MALTSRTRSYLTLHSFLCLKHDELKGSSNAEFNPWTEKEKIQQVSGILRSISTISNIYKKEEPINVKRFYYPSKVFKKSSDPSDSFNVNLYKDFKSSKSIIIEGTVGQGKSILLRYLHDLELNDASSFPIFIELKDIKEESLVDYIVNYISNCLGLRCSESLFFELLNIGALSLFFDGFDEVEHSKRTRIVEDINNIAHHNENNKTYCTSRPNNEIQRSNKFDVFCIKPLNEEEQIGFIDKMMESYEERVEYRSQLNKNISSMKAELRKLLQTPLILTLFIMVYRRRVMVPETTAKFYRMLFNTLVSEHDGMKLGFVRPTISGLSAEQIHTVLEYLSFIYVNKVIDEEDVDFKVIVNGALSISQIKNGSANEVLEDLTKNTCLIQLDDHEHKFIHESIPFYFAASCVLNNTDDDESKSFYEGRYNTLDDWRHVLDFLKNIDKKNFNRFFLIKQLESFFIRKELPEKFIFSNKSALNFAKNFKIYFLYSVNGKSSFYTDINYLPVNDWVSYNYFTDVKSIKNRVNLNYVISIFSNYFEELSANEFFNKIDKLNKPIKSSNFYIIQEDLDKVLDVFDLGAVFEKEINKVPLDTIKYLYHETSLSIKKYKENKDRGFFSV
ncbi:hypothetical protein EDB59_1096 [Vibrio crassostreae]|uniref:NACHT domain-containing protein n=1 Tax=Vibrio crassostreae TaxID=246167 RepID=UPI000F49145C|nr:hypothetical protein [Vibrio crassostreae]ROR70442.1 hypothetical protein EDB59_1096 [Vibrio crassostreae]